MVARKFLVYSLLTVINFHFLLVKMPWEGDEALNEGQVTHAPFYETVPFGWVVG
jgi:hypothetical protein